LSTGTYKSTPSTTPRSDAQGADGTVTAESQQRAEALEREAADRGESKWYLSFKEPETAIDNSPLRIVSAGYSTLDAGPSVRERSLDDDDDVIPTRPQVAGRRSFGKFNKAVEVRFGLHTATIKLTGGDRNNRTQTIHLLVQTLRTPTQAQAKTKMKAMILQAHKHSSHSLVKRPARKRE